MNRIMRELAAAFPNERTRLALRALIGTDERPERVDYPNYPVKFWADRSRLASSPTKIFAPALTLSHVRLIKGALDDAPEPWRQIVQAVVSYVEKRDTIELYERERELQPCGACGGEPFTTIDGRCTACNR
jgi:hypothetical protein